MTGDVEKMKVERFFQSRVGRLWIRQSSEGGVYIGLDDGAPAASYCSVESAEDAFRSRGTGIPAWDLLGDIDDLPLLLSDWDQRVRPSVN